MNLQQLLAFVTVADCGKMSLAAKKLFLTESAVSQAITKLEREYNIKLFERIGKKLHLTQAGKQFLFYGRQLFAMDKEVSEHLKNLSILPQLKVGASNSIGFRLLNSVLPYFYQAWPETNVTMYLYSYSHILRQIKDNQLDIALVSDMSTTDVEELFVLKPVSTDQGLIICGPTHPFWDQEQIEPQQLQDQPFIIREKYNGFRVLFDQYLRDNDLTIQVKGICNNAEASKYAILNQPYLTYTSYQVCRQEIEANLIKPISLPGLSLKRRISLLYHKDKLISPLMNGFMQICTKYAGEFG